MGFADMLIKLGIGYNTGQAVKFAGKLMRFIQQESRNASTELANERGCFPNFKHSIYTHRQKMRNATLNTVAPTGTISIIADCSSGIEPIFALSYIRNVLSGAQLFETNKIFEQQCRKHHINIDDLTAEISQKGSIKHIAKIPEEIKRIFVTAFDISPFDHLAIEAAFQKHTDNAVSKTINLPPHATVDDIREIYLKAHELKCKGITVYRYGSKPKQVLSFGSASNQKGIRVESEYAGGCAKNSCCF